MNNSPEEDAKYAQAALERIEFKLVETKHAARHVSNEDSGMETLMLTADGIRLQQSLLSLFGENGYLSANFTKFDAVALVYTLLPTPPHRKPLPNLR